MTQAQRGDPDTGLADALELVRDRLARSPGELTPHRVAEALRASGRPVGDATVLAVHEALRRDVVGAGPLEPLLRTPGVTDVLVNGPERVYLDRGAGLEDTGVRFPDESAVRRLAQRLAGLGGRRLDDATPYADLRLPDGTRFHAVLAPLSRPGTTISLRVPRRRTFTVSELVEVGTLSSDTARVVEAVVAARLAFLVSGGTGSGKTTLLAALLSLVAPAERLVLVEDASELRPDHPHVVGLEGRPANIEGAGAIDVRTLVRQALRMRPDRLVVGEVRILRGVSQRPVGTLPSTWDTRDSSWDTSPGRSVPLGTLPPSPPQVPSDGASFEILGCGQARGVPSQWLTYAEAAKQYGCSCATLRKLVIAGRIQQRSSTRGGSLEQSSVESALLAVSRDRAEAALRRSEGQNLERADAAPGTGDVWLSAAAAATVLGVSPQLVGRLASAERLPATRCGRRWWFRRQDIEQAAAARVFVRQVAGGSRQR